MFFKKVKTKKKAKFTNNKVKLFIKVIIVLSLLLTALLAVFGVLFMHHKKIRDKDNEEIKKLNSYISGLKSKTKTIRLEMDDAKKYRKTWAAIDSNKKKFDGVQIKAVTENFEKLAEHYNVKNATIKVSVPEVLKGKPYDYNSFEILLSTVDVSFKSYDDLRAISFIHSFLKVIPGYIIVTSFAVAKEKDVSYEEKDLIDISKGAGTPNIKGSLSFSWYSLKRK